MLKLCTSVQSGAKTTFRALTFAVCTCCLQVIPRKDLPPIYTMCVPVDAGRGEGAHGTNSNVAAGSSIAAARSASITDGRPGAATGGMTDAIADLAATRAEIVAEVAKAPLRRVDNMITRLYDSARLLRMHAAVMSAAKKDYMSDVAKYVGSLGLGASGLGGLAATLIYSGNLEVGAPVAALSLLLSGAAGWWVRRELAARADYYIDGPGLDNVFRRLHYLQLAEKDEFVAQLWERVRPQLQTALRTLGLRGVPFARRADLQALDDIVEKEVPALRLAATKAGALYSSSSNSGSSSKAAGSSSSAPVSDRNAPSGSTSPSSDKGELR